jgi:hypothetical protein
MDQKANGVEPGMPAVLPQADLHCRGGLEEPYDDHRFRKECSMRPLIAVTLILSFFMPLASPAEAQSARLPRKSNAERQVEDINRNLRQGDRLRQLEQQYQVDSNQFRQGLDRQRAFSNPPARIGTCPVGSIGC